MGERLSKGKFLTDAPPAGTRWSQHQFCVSVTCGGGSGPRGTRLWSLFLSCEVLTLGVTLCSITVPEEKTPPPKPCLQAVFGGPSSEKLEVTLTQGWVQPEVRECGGPRPGPPRHLLQGLRGLMGRGSAGSAWLRVEGPGVPVGLNCLRGSCSVHLFCKVVFWPWELAVDGSGTPGGCCLTALPPWS